MKLLVATLFVSVSMATTASANCGFYERENGTGVAFELASNSTQNNIGAIMISRRSWYGYFGGWQGRDRSFNDEVSSVAVSQGCSVELYKHSYFQEIIAQLPEGTHNLTPGIDNQATSAICRCGGEIRSTNPVSDASSPGIVLPGFWGGF
jgi:hypothetical protein